MKGIKIAAVIVALAVAAVGIFFFVKAFIDGHGGLLQKPPETTAPVTTQPPVTLPSETTEPSTLPPETPPATMPTTVPPVTLPPASVTPVDPPLAMYATANGVNIRMQPTTVSDRYGTLNRGDQVTVTGRTADGWCRIVFRELYTGYVYAEYLTMEPVVSDVTVTPYEAPVTRYATETVNVRASYSTNSAKLGVIAAGEAVAVTGVTSNGWYRVSYQNAEAFVYAPYLAETKPAPTESQNPAEGTTTPSV